MLKPGNRLTKVSAGVLILIGGSIILGDTISATASFGSKFSTGSANCNLVTYAVEWNYFTIVKFPWLALVIKLADKLVFNGVRLS